jgi:hypothetical protein
MKLVDDPTVAGGVLAITKRHGSLLIPYNTGAIIRSGSKL